MRLTDDLRNAVDTAKRLTMQAFREPRILEIPGGFLIAPRDADPEETAELFVRGHQVGARDLAHEIEMAIQREKGE